MGLLKPLRAKQLDEYSPGRERMKPTTTASSEAGSRSVKYNVTLMRSVSVGILSPQKAVRATESIVIWST